MDNDNSIFYKLRILIVDDNLVNIKLIVAIFASHECIIDVALNGLEAVEKVRTHTFDIVLMDIQMPELDGIEASNIIREELKSDVPIIAVSAVLDTDKIERAKKVGINDFISKPISKALLEDKIRFWQKIYKMRKTKERESGKKRLLFVDDDESFLNSVQLSLQHMLDMWEVRGASTGKEALAIMEEKRVDIIISDLRMPGMGGIELLLQVQEKYPECIRFVLSGYSDEEMVLNVLGFSDQFITKPCEPEMLIDKIERALEAKESFNRKAKPLAFKLRSLPVLPEVYLELKKTLESHTSSFCDVADVISKDIVIVAKVLRLVNSAFFGLPHPIDDLQHAISFLGMETLKALILTTNTFSSLDPESIDYFHIRGLYNHSIAVGALARRITETVSEERSTIDQASVSGMLTDIGKVIFIRNLEDEYKEIFRRHFETKQNLCEIEKECFGITHAEMGGYLMSVWGLPDTIVDAVRYHHTPGRLAEKNFNAVSAVHIADALVCENVAKEEQCDIQQLDERYVDTIGAQNHIQGWRKIYGEEIMPKQEEFDLFS